MRLKGKILLGGIIALSSIQLKAQSFAETALLFSRTTPGGSARIQSLGGSQISLGGDYSSALSNPAGLGMYNKSEFVLTPALNIAPSSSLHMGEKTNDSKTTFYIPGLAASFHGDYKNLSGFLGGTFTIAFNRTNDFNRNIKYQGTNPNNSIIDAFIEDSNGFSINQFSAGGALFNTPTELAFNNYLIGDSTVVDPAADPTQYFTDVLGIPFQSEEISTRKAQNQWSLSYGVNYNDRLFIGAGLGINSIKFISTKIYTEDFVGEPLFDLQLEENLEIRGTGINGTFGAIYRPVDVFQFGFSATTPTHFEMTDTYSATMSTNWDNFQYDPGTLLNSVQALTDIVISEYSYNTPWKLNAGATFFLNKKGFISLDAERVDYSKANYKSITSGISFNEDNDEIKSLYRTVYNIRAGAEYRHGGLSYRAGYAFMPDPFISEQNDISRKITKFSAGIGYRTANYYVDFAAIYSIGQSSYRPYTVNSINSPLVESDLSNINILITVGLPF